MRYKGFKEAVRLHILSNLQSLRCQLSTMVNQKSKGKEVMLKFSSHHIDESRDKSNS
jgi:hypothetical protein